VAGIAAAIVAGVGLLTCALVSFMGPLGGDDWLAIWGLKARALYRTGELASVLRPDPDGEFSHPEYPLLWPIALAAAARLSGGLDDRLVGAVWTLLCGLGAALAFRATRAPLPFRLACAAFVACLPYYHRPRYVGFAEPLLLLWLLAALAESDRLARGRGPLARFALFLALAAGTKNEGAVAALAATAALALGGWRRAALAAAGFVLLAGVLPWRLLLPQSQEALADFALGAFDLSHVAVVLGVLLHEAMLPNAAWLLGAALLAAVGWPALARRRGVLVALAIHLALLLASFAFTVHDPTWHAQYTWRRLLFVPIAVLAPVLAECAACAVAAGSAPATAPQADARAEAQRA
jgi:hypothetical protein